MFRRIPILATAALSACLALPLMQNPVRADALDDVTRSMPAAPEPAGAATAPTGDSPSPERAPARRHRSAAELERVDVQINPNGTISRHVGYVGDSATSREPSPSKMAPDTSPAADGRIPIFQAAREAQAQRVRSLLKGIPIAIVVLLLSGRAKLVFRSGKQRA